MQSTEPTGSIPERLSKTPSCVNCGDAPCKNVFEGLLLCAKCYYHVHFLLKKCKRELAMTFDVYKRVLRIAALDKKLLSQKGIRNGQKSKTTAVQSKV